MAVYIAIVRSESDAGSHAGGDRAAGRRSYRAHRACHPGLGTGSNRRIRTAPRINALGAFCSSRSALGGTGARAAGKARENPEGPTLFNFANPLELRVSAIPANVEPPSEVESVNTEVVNTDDIAAELERLLERESEPQSHGTEIYRQREPDPKEK
jgi:hypothetical protein